MWRQHCLSTSTSYFPTCLSEYHALSLSYSSVLDTHIYLFFSHNTQVFSVSAFQNLVSVHFALLKMWVAQRSRNLAPISVNFSNYFVSSVNLTSNYFIFSFKLELTSKHKNRESLGDLGGLICWPIQTYSCKN